MVLLYVKIFLAIKKRSKEMEKMTAFQSKEMMNHFGDLCVLPNLLFSGCTAGEGTADSLSEEENNLAGKETNSPYQLTFKGLN